MKDDDLSGREAANKPPSRSGGRDFLDRLFRSAGPSNEGDPVEMPFGFDTRVVALWRANGNGAVRGLSSFLRRIALVATAVILLAAGGIYHEINQNRELSEPSANEFAIADTVIENEFAQ
jgi:hypothetical protein